MSENTPAITPEVVYVPYEFLARWDEETGAYKASHAIFFEHTRFNGVTLTKVMGGALTPEQAAALGFPFEDVLDKTLVDALIALDKANAENEALKRTIAELKTAPPPRAEELESQAAIIQQLMAENEALKAPPQE